MNEQNKLTLRAVIPHGEPNRLIGFFARHLVGIVHEYERPDGQLALYVVTTFVLSVCAEWFLVTAGHIFKDDIHPLLESGILRYTYLTDHFGGEARHSAGIPFNWREANYSVFGTGGLDDLSAIVVTPNMRELLLQNGIEPLNELVWKIPPPPDIHFCMIAGFPSVLTKEDRFECVVCPVNLLPDQSEPDPVIPFGRFHGIVGLGNPATCEPLTDIRGMSGAPLFAFHRVEGQPFKYWLIGVQSTWTKSTRTIHACPTYPLGRCLEDILNGKLSPPDGESESATDLDEAGK